VVRQGRGNSFIGGSRFPRRGISDKKHKAALGEVLPKLVINVTRDIRRLIADH
jgi:hypothetical protein